MTSRTPILNLALAAAGLAATPILAANATPPLKVSDNHRFLVTDRVPTSVPGAGRYRYVATRDQDGSYAMVYVLVARKFMVHMDKITGPKVKAWWFNPRDGKATAIGEFPNTGEREFTPPDLGEQLDWVLVLDDAAKHFPVPGQTPGR